MESPGVYPDSPMDADEAVYPCKGCGEILEEGKAFELAGNRWHIDCFRCNTCKTLLDSDANLLLLGDGSLICNNCTYSCNACNNKIEDLAILTGDQAFCANCFKCRNCKRRIENLRYARTSQGIFCMSCHESLMARRRKKSKQSRMNSNGGPVTLDKSLPALPQSAVPPSAFAPTPETGTPPPEFYTDTPPEMSPRPHMGSRRNDGSTGPPNKRLSTPTDDESRKENLTLPASTYAENRHSFISQSDASRDAGGADDGFFIPMALDPNPAPGPSPMSGSGQFEPVKSHPQSTSVEADYLTKGSRLPPTASQRDILKENGSRSSSVDRVRRDGSYPKPQISPHIAYQQRQPSTDYIDAKSRRDVAVDSSPAMDTRHMHSQSSSAYNSQPSTPNEFKLQDVPRSRKGSVSRKLSKPSPAQRSMNEKRQSTDLKGQNDGYSTPGAPTPREGSPALHTEQLRMERPTRGDSLERPARGDSLNTGQPRQAIARKEVASEAPESPMLSMPGQPSHERTASSLSSAPRTSQDSQRSLAQLNGGRAISKPNESDVSKSILDVPSLPARSASRPSVLAGNDSFSAPRAAPAPPTERHKTSDSVSTIHSNMSAQLSPTLPRYSAGEHFSMEEEMGRIMKGEQIDDRDSAVLRKVSNAAKHMRSFSDRGQQSTSKIRDHRFVRSPTNGSVDLGSISSPTSATPEGKEDAAMLKNQLRRLQKRNAELEGEKSHLIDLLNSNQSIQAVNEDLKQKRSTMAFLDTQREIVVRELEVMTEHLKKAKELNQPLNLSTLKSDIMRDFGASMQKLKHELGAEIEDLIHKRNEITNEIADLIQMKDRGNQEYEDLSHRNQQLTQLNNELVQSIQKMYEAGSDKARPPRPQLGSNGLTIGAPLMETRSASSGVTSPNGLGIYNHQSANSISLDPSRSNSQDPSLQTLVNEDAESAVMSSPHVINIRKGRPNMWKKGSQAVAKNIRGIKGAFASTNQYQGPYGTPGMPGTLTEGVPYGSMQEGMRPNNNDMGISGPMNVRKGDPNQYPFWAQDKGKKMNKLAAPMGMPNGSSTNLTGENGLFGTDLSQRCQFEKRDIPSVVLSCIQEVELRGMDVEGVYRKSGGSGQVNAVRAGFERDANHDVSDPDLDIHAVTSCLKQYFRRLPVPLITFDVYDGLLEAASAPDHEQKMQGMRACMEALPKAHRDVLSFLVFHLARVMAREPQNLMSSLNLAVVFAPTIMRPQEIEREMTDMQAQRMAVQSLLENNQIIFADE